ncbi:MAG TPA: FtsX-like permease family protein [Thermoleophilaceae bacterium]
MTRVALRGLAARKLRAFTTWLAIFLGVALVAGTYVLTDTINHSFEEIFTESLKGTDVAITARNDVEQQDTGPPAFPASLLQKVRSVDGVEAAEGSVFASARFVDKDGDPIGSQFAPNFVSSTQSKRFEALDYKQGRPPLGAHEASIDTQTADNGDLKLGGRLRIAGERHVTSYRIVGLTQLGNASFGGAGIAQLTLPEAQRVTDRVGQFDQISIAAEPGVSPVELRDRLREVMPPQVQVETGTQSAKRQSNDIEDDLSFLKITLLVFAGVSLFVGAFLIFNTFSITVAQRTREFGMLRTLGASRRQVLGSVLLEALLLGVLGAAAGLAGGLAFAAGINALFKSIGIDLPNTGNVVETRTIVVSVLVGVVVTLVSAMFPAIRATRVTPMAALREGDLPGSARRGRVLTAFAVLLSLGGLALICVGLFGGIDDSGSAAGMVGGGAAAILLGVSLFSSRLVRPLASLVGKPMERIRGLTGRLARENAMRKPGRTAATSAALMIGLALVVFVTVFAAGINASVGKAIDRNFKGQLVLQNIDGFSPIPQQAVEEAARVPGVTTASSLSSSAGKVDGSDIRVAGVDPATVDSVLSLDWKKGSPATLSGLGAHEAIADDAWAKDNDLEVGDTVRVKTPTERTVTFTIRGTVKDNADLLGNLVVDQETLRTDFARTAPSMGFLAVAPGANVDRVQDRVDDVITRAFPTVEVQNQQELKDSQRQQVNQLLGLIYALLSLAVIVSLFGIVNTLALSIHERTRELGMLRAVGMSRRQVRTMIRYEAVITALIGALLGTVLGIIFAALLSAPLSDEGFELAYPVPTLIILLILAAFAGVLAAIGPARRASRLNVLEALAYE